MTIALRRILYVTFALVFFLLAPALVLYTAGYRYDWSRRKILLTGSLVVKTFPSDASVFLNNKQVAKKTPLRENNLLPNAYAVSARKPGYQPWDKKLEIYPGQTTFVENIILWPENAQRITLVKGTISIFTVSKDESKIIYQEKNAVKLLNMLNKKISDLIILPTAAVAAFTWSDNGQKMLVAQGDNYWVVDFAEQAKVTALSTLIAPPFNRPTFYPESSDLIMYIKNSRLFSFNLVTKKNKKIVSEKIVDYLWHQGNWFYVTQGTPTYLTFTSPSTKENKPPLFQLPPSSSYRFIAVINNYALIYQPETTTLYLFNLDPSQFNNTSYIIKQVSLWQLNGRKDKLLLASDFEVWTFDLKSYTSNIITRVSERINDIAWYKEDNYLLVQFSDRISMIENDHRDSRNQATLMANASVTQISLGDSGSFLYLLQQEQDKNALIRLKIAEFNRFPF